VWSSELVRLEESKQQLTDESRALQQQVHAIEAQLRSNQHEKRMAQQSIDNQQTQLSGMSRGSKSKLSMFGGAPLEQVR
jgi:predicted  nucleic acid-binding Zn-ribbon protein